MPNEAHSKLLADVFQQLTPEMALLGLACLLFLGGTFKVSKALWGCVTLVGLGAAGVLLANSGQSAPPDSPLVFDSLSNLVRWIALGSGVLLTLFGWSEVPEAKAGEFFACLVLIVVGMGLTGAANDLVILFLALELVSIPTYVLLYLPRQDQQAQEAALKYFMISIFSSALLLFGFSYLYGLSGTTNLTALLKQLNTSVSGQMPDVPLIGMVALIMVVAGLGFRITAVPFHFYAPDVYQGTSNVCAGLLAFVPKLAGFTALFRVLGFVLPQGVAPRNDLAGIGLSDHVPVLFWFLAVVSMFLGNVLGLLQTNVKRLLAYSSVAHAGYMLIALASAPFLAHDGQSLDGTASLLFYLVAYGVMTIGAFAVLSYLSSGPQSPGGSEGQQVETIDDLAGLGTSRPGIAFMMAIFLFSLIGIPLTAGFAGKFLIFFGAMSIPQPEYAVLFRVLALLGVLNAAIGGWYYLRILAVMYLRQPLTPITGRRSCAGLATLWVCVVLTIGFGIPPAAGWLMHQTQQATAKK